MSHIWMITTLVEQKHDILHWPIIYLTKTTKNAEAMCENMFL